MTARPLRYGAIAALVACAPPLGHSRDDSAVIEPIEQVVTVDTPVPATLYVAYRAVSYPGHVVEYGVEVDDRPMIVTYAIEPTSALPLATRVYDGLDGAPLIALLADDRQLDVYLGDATAPVHVADYLTQAADGDAIALAAVPAHVRPVLDAVLPARAELAPIPAFWRNLDQPPPPGGDLGSSSSAGRALLPMWSAPVSLLGALFVQGPCVRDDRYQCPCMRVELAAVGSIATCTEARLDELPPDRRKPALSTPPDDVDADRRNRAIAQRDAAATPLH